MMTRMWRQSRAGLAFAAILLLPSFVTGVKANIGTDPVADIKEMVVDEALRTGVPPALALAVAKVESNFKADAVSKAGARGVMQIMPATAKKRYGVDPDSLFDPRLNIQLGVDFLIHLYHHYDEQWDLALSHYNGGSIKGWRKTNRPHRYTAKYLQSVRRWQSHFEDVLTDEFDIWPSDQPLWAETEESTHYQMPRVGIETHRSVNPTRTPFTENFFQRLRDVRATMDDFSGNDSSVIVDDDIEQSSGTPKKSNIAN